MLCSWPQQVLAGFGGDGVDLILCRLLMLHQGPAANLAALGALERAAPLAVALSTYPNGAAVAGESAAKRAGSVTGAVTGGGRDTDWSDADWAAGRAAAAAVSGKGVGTQPALTRCTLARKKKHSKARPR